MNEAGGIVGDAARLPFPHRRAYRMVMAPATRRWTREEVLALPDDGRRYELVDGELLVTPSPAFAHQQAVLVLIELLQPYLRRHPAGYLSIAPADLSLQNDQLVQPDLFVVPPVEGRRPHGWEEVGIPLLVIEVLSSSTARHDRFTKRLRYQRSGVQTYWIVDIDARLVEVWRPGDDRPAVLHDELAWSPDPEASPLVIGLPAFFREVLGEE